MRAPGIPEREIKSGGAVMHKETREKRKADASRRKYRELLALDASGYMISAKEIRRAREVLKIRQASLDGRGVSM